MSSKSTFLFYYTQTCADCEKEARTGRVCVVGPSPGGGGRAETLLLSAEDVGGLPKLLLSEAWPRWAGSKLNPCPGKDPSPDSASTAKSIAFLTCATGGTKPGGAGRLCLGGVVTDVESESVRMTGGGGCTGTCVLGGGSRCNLLMSQFMFEGKYAPPAAARVCIL